MGIAVDSRYTIQMRGPIAVWIVEDSPKNRVPVHMRDLSIPH